MGTARYWPSSHRWKEFEAMAFLHLGRIVATANVAGRFNHDQLFPLLCRHVSGDWGDVDPGDWRLNDDAVQNGDRVMSVYEIDNQTLWIITEADRSVTTILFPSEY